MSQVMSNPYRVGTQAHAVFSNLLPTKMCASKDELVGQYKACRRFADDWLNQSDAIRCQYDFEAEVIAKVFEHRFEQSIDFACWQRA